jgi:hypothetical protein
MEPGGGTPPSGGTSPAGGTPAATGKATAPGLVAGVLFAVAIGVPLVPIVPALLLNRRFQRRHPGRRPFRWGYYFGIQSCVAGIVLGLMFESGVGPIIVCGGIYAILAWLFARRHRWAWVALTILSFNPVAWILNAVYLRKRWAED